MRRTPLAAHLFVLCAALLLLAPSVLRAEHSVRFVVTIPESECGEALHGDKTQRSQVFVHPLLREAQDPNLKIKVGAPSCSLTLSGKGWIEEVGAAQKLEAVRALESLWGSGRVMVYDGVPGLAEDAGPMPAEKRVPVEGKAIPADAVASAQRVREAVAGAVGKDGLVLFDQGRLRQGGAVIAAETGTPLAASAYGLQAVLPSAGGLRIGAVPAPGALAPAPQASKGPYEDILRAEASAAGIDPAVLRALLAAKGGFESSPSRKSGGSYGLLLITPFAARSVGLADADLKDPEVNLRVGALLMKDLLDRYKGDVHRALAAYQLGTGAVTRSGGLPNDPGLKSFLAAYERAYRGGPEKPKVVAVQPPKAPAVRTVLEERREASAPRPAASRDPIARYRKMIEVVAKKRGVDPDLLEAIMRAENPWGDPMRVSPAGAVGLMQLMPATAAHYRADPRNPEQSVDAAARHLNWLLDYFEGDKVLAVAAYNAGHVPVEKHGRIPNYAETKGYVRKVFASYNQLSDEEVDYSAYMPKVSTVAKKGKKRK